MAREAVIEIERLKKYYGRHRGIEELDLTVQAGEVYGFLGPNGAGKTTTINLLLDFRQPSGGRAKIFGQPVTRATSLGIRRRIGFIPGELSLYERMTGHDFLNFFGNLHGKVDAKYRTELAERFDLDLSRKIGQLSKGNKQKVGLLQALQHQPELLILDEPTSGLDPLIQHEFYAVIHEQRKAGRTVFLSSHVMSEVERICDRAAIIRDGRLVSVERIASLHERVLRHVEVHFGEKPPVVLIRGIKGVLDVRADGHVLHCTVQGSMDELIKKIARFKVQNLISEHASLEEVFFSDYQEAGDAT